MIFLFNIFIKMSYKFAITAIPIIGYLYNKKLDNA
jgi:hypothetical protein